MSLERRTRQPRCRKNVRHATSATQALREKSDDGVRDVDDDDAAVLTCADGAALHEVPPSWLAPTRRIRTNQRTDSTQAAAALRAAKNGDTTTERTRDVVDDEEAMRELRSSRRREERTEKRVCMSRPCPRPSSFRHFKRPIPGFPYVDFSFPFLKRRKEQMKKKGLSTNFWKNRSEVGSQDLR